MGEERIDLGEGSPWPAALELEDLLEQLRGRARTAQRSQERLGALLDAVVAVSADLDLSVVLARIVRSACQLVDARYGALGVLGPDGEHLSEFITYGLTEKERTAIGDLPRGRGVLGLLIRDPRARRVRDISAHPESSGFPRGHPPMHSFLGTPIRIRDRLYGNLYLSEKQGAPEFTADDESMLIALAANAGVAIDNAQLYEHARRQRRWSDASGEITRMLLEGRGESSALALMVRRVRELTGAGLAAVGIHDDEGLVVRAIDAVDGAAEIGTLLRGDQWGELMSGREPLLLVPGSGEDLPQPAMVASARALGTIDSAGPTALVPIAVGEAELGVLVVAWHPSAESTATASLADLADFAALAGLGLEAAGAQRERARTVLLEDRDRIARDMHDHVIQRLFATGLSLQSAARLATNQVVQDRIDVAVDELDAAIKDIRNSIFALHRPDFGAGVRGELDEIVAASAESLGFVPDFVVEGLLVALPDYAEVDLVAVVREGLSNIVRHANATSASVHVSVNRDLVVEVSDDGVGAEPGAIRSGLANLERRALSSGGTFEVRRREPTGTLLRWSVPL